MKPTLICVSVPSMGDVKIQMLHSLVKAMFYTSNSLECGLSLYTPVGVLIDYNRNKSVNEALRLGASHLLFVDSDMAFPQDAVVTLASREKDIIGVPYNYKIPNKAWTTIKIMGEDGTFVQTDKIPTELFKAGAVGTGFMLIKTEIFKTIPKPWFFYKYIEEDDYTAGTDIYFCEKAREYGYDIWCDPTIPMKHIGDYAY